MHKIINFEVEHITSVIKNNFQTKIGGATRAILGGTRPPSNQNLVVLMSPS